ncbi:MAG TPA: hypothetical protein VFE91_06690 [Nitrososphaerales archaeon]|nr:hypothetical protein [Nitrososphaerales archaeon]
MDLPLLDIAQALILILGGIVVFYASRAFRRTRSQAMILLALGFAFVTAGAVVAGLLYNYFTGDLASVVTLQAYSQAIGFFIIVYSLAKAKS